MVPDILVQGPRNHYGPGLFDGGFDDSIFSLLHVFAGHIYFYVWFDTEFQLVHVGVEHRAGRETDGPSVGNLRAEGET